MIASDPALAELIYTSGVVKVLHMRAMMLGVAHFRCHVVLCAAEQFLLSSATCAYAPCALAVLGALAILCQSGNLATRLVDDGLVEVLYKCLKRSTRATTAAVASVTTKALAALLAIVENNVPAGCVANCCVIEEDEKDEADEMYLAEEANETKREENILPYLETAFDSGSAEHVTIALKLLLHVHPHCSAGKFKFDHQRCDWEASSRVVGLFQHNCMVCGVLCTNS